MSIKKTIGGDRLGSGNKMSTSLHNYNRSTHNLTESFRSTMAPGVLVPFLVKPALNGDTFDIDLNAMCRTIPTQGPLMGTFKLQLDVFTCPIRLYQGLLHNNPLDIGMEMSKVPLPKIEISKTFQTKENTFEKRIKAVTFANNSLLKYLGLSGIGAPLTTLGAQTYMTRKFNAVPILAYYDIFKNYYANKQEENAYVISGNTFADESEFINLEYVITDVVELEVDPSSAIKSGIITPIDEEFTLDLSNIMDDHYGTTNSIKITGTKLNTTNYIVSITESESGEVKSYKLEDNEKISIIERNDNIINFVIKGFVYGNTIIDITKDTEPKNEEDIAMVAFPLKNIDKAREKILASTAINTAVEIATNGDIDFLPYSILTSETTEHVQFNTFKMNGLLVKTYQADLFNAWVNTEWIDGTNGIAEITKIDTSDGLKLDTLNLAQKVYNMLNRIAVSGGTYEDWQEAVYGVNAVRRAESPIYCGGMASEIVFEEVISTAATDTQSGDDTGKLGTLAGKGTLQGQKGGKLHIKITEPSFIIGIASITPRLDYTQGNEWYMTDLMTMDDLHKPALDGIGFQNLMEEQACFWGTKVVNGAVSRRIIGKVPAWVNYMTSYDKAFGDFAENEGKNFMILARNYSREKDTDNTLDLTTYIEPEKFNYAFAYKELAAQNFWLQIYSQITARRIMSAKIIPNL